MSDIVRPRLTRPGPEDNKYSRGLVTVIGGDMPGAAALAALGAARAGAGYVQLVAPARITGLPYAVVQREAADLTDERIGAIVVGPGLGAADPLRALTANRPLVVDAEAIMAFEKTAGPAILTPHEGEYARRWPHFLRASRGERAYAAARATGAVVLLKGVQTVVASPDGRVAVAPTAPHALATAGTGDVLAGLCGTMLAQLGDPFLAAQAAVWLHAEAARQTPVPFVADDLVQHLPAAVRACW